MNSKKIVVKIAAGLGNQMFMYANAYTLSKKYSLNLTVDNTSGYFQKKNRTLSREYGLDIFNLSSKKSSKEDKFDTYLKHFFKKFLVFFDKFFSKKTFFKEKINNEKMSYFIPIDISNSKKKYTSKVIIKVKNIFLNLKRILEVNFQLI